MEYQNSGPSGTLKHLPDLLTFILNYILLKKSCSLINKSCEIWWKKKYVEKFCLSSWLPQQKIIQTVKIVLCKLLL